MANSQLILQINIFRKQFILTQRFQVLSKQHEEIIRRSIRIAIIGFTVKIFMHKKYQELPNQFIPKYNHKYQLKKTLINTKFQWLMKYLRTDEQIKDQTNLSKLINVQQKQAVAFSEKKMLKQQNNFFNVKQADEENCPISKIKPKQRESFSKRNENSLKTSICMSKNPNFESALLENSKNQSRISYSRNTIRPKRSPSFFEKQNRKASVKSRDMGRIKTQGNFSRVKTKNQYLAKYQREPFILSPWVFTQENVENSQQDIRF